MPRVFNFSAGPAMLPDDVMHQAHAEFLDYHNLGYSVCEMPHRGKDFKDIAERTEADLRELLAIPENYKVLVMPGGARAQYAAIPFNLLKGRKKAAYLDIGHWSKEAIVEAHKYCDVNVIASNADPAPTYIPPIDQWNINGDEAYLHYVDNETIGGVEFPHIPDTKGLTLVGDMSSNILSRPIDISKYGLIYACAQKNLGPAGVTLVIVREDLIGDEHPLTPAMMSYTVFSTTDSMYNTPPTFPWYMMGLVAHWVKKQGGLEEMDRMAKLRSNLLNDFIKNSDFYKNPVDPSCRSRMNVPFILADESYNDAFLNEASDVGLVNLKGHRAVGGMRASMYNAMPESGVEALISFMQAFEDKVS